MKVEIISHTKDALELLIYTKDTRLKGGKTLAEIKNWSREKKLDHFNYMLGTIKSSFEFVNYTFKISGVTRAFTHQLVRTRHASYAQEAQRVIDASEHPILGPDSDIFREAAAVAVSAYSEMIKEGTQIQNARNILPIGTTTSIIGQFNLRTLHEMAKVRLCTRAQGEYQEVFRKMVQEVFFIHDWAADFLKVACAWDGVCVFPNYTECPVQPLTIKATKEELYAIQGCWKEIRFEANPIAKEGKT